jgi:mono/diheme cytochrome c family protein
MNRPHETPLWFASALALLACSCGPTAAEKEAKKLYEEQCAACHGLTGKGDGAAAAQLKPRPQDYTKAEWQERVSDDELRAVIVNGGKAVGRSNDMPSSPDLATKPEVVNALVKIVRGFKK